MKGLQYVSKAMTARQSSRLCTGLKVSSAGLSQVNSSQGTRARSDVPEWLCPGREQKWRASCGTSHLLTSLVSVGPLEGNVLSWLRFRRPQTFGMPHFPLQPFPESIASQKHASGTIGIERSRDRSGESRGNPIQSRHGDLNNGHTANITVL